MALSVRQDAVWKAVAALWVRQSAAWKPVRKAWIRRAGVWEEMWEGLRADCTPDEVLDTITEIGGGTSTSPTVTVVASNGAGPYTYSWQFVSLGGDVAATFTSAAGTTVEVTAFLNVGQTASGSFICVVTDTETGLVVDSNAVTFSLVNVA